MPELEDMRTRSRRGWAGRVVLTTRKTTSGRDPAKTGVKKMSKSQRLKQQQEEDERRLREEEEARAKKEKEEMERLEKKRIEREKWEKLEAKDLERRTEELAELSFLEMCFAEAEKLKRDFRMLAQWKHYLECDRSPDPSVAQEINTYISLWKEETDETFEQVMRKSNQVLSLIERLTLILLETPPFDLQTKNIIQYEGSILELQELLFLKFNRATEILLRQASTLADLDSGNMEKVIQSENITLYVWANLKKNPKYRSIRFSGTEVGFEIPRILATSDIALRLLHTHFDHVSPLPTVKATLDTFDEPVKEEVPLEEAAASQEAEAEAEAEVEAEAEAEVIQEAEAEAEAESPQSTVEEDPRAITYELEMTLLSKRVSAVHLKMLKNTEEKPHIFEDHVVDLCQFSTLGGVYHLDILELPPQYKPVKGWVIVRILKEGLQKYIYPPETTDEAEMESSFPPIEVTLEVHKNVVFFESPMVARWDAKVKCWKTNGISQVSYNSKERLVTFSIDTLSPITLIQDTHINMPFQSWELVPLEVNQVLFTVTTVFTKIQIHIKDNLCQLASIELQNNEKFTFLEGKWMSITSFILALKTAGLNIFPTAQSHFYVVINYKTPMVEMKAYRQMALLSSAFAFGWSRWNIHCDSRKVVFKASEHLTKEEPIQDLDWIILMFTGERAQRLNISEYSEEFSESPLEESEFHSTLYHMVKDFASLEALEGIRKTSYSFIDTVCNMLLATRLLSYS
ncbi:dynein axonemal intermediate chain 7 [Suncus etruscus]|uniref:dynein axonemal intermediate chain 7 n=1 Tax=Suncus etruscus TaxID=109475 RepID=UPI00210FBFF3|nr:dynein axonemal intermediate chain 7 [Suncus etruscus]